MDTPNPHGLATLAFAGVIATQFRRKPPYDVAIAGLPQETLNTLKDRYFPNAAFELDAQTPEQQALIRTGEFGDLLKLLLDNATEDNDETRWVAHAVATAGMAGNRLWQDMGLPDSSVLTELMTSYFHPLASRNTGNMNWKRFFYRAQCEQKELNLCSVSSCSTCSDQPECPGSENSDSKITFVR